LLPLDGLDYNLPDNSALESKVKKAVKNSMKSIMLKEIKKWERGNLQKSKREYTNFYDYYINKNKNNENLVVTAYMIYKTLVKMSADEVAKIEKIYEELSHLANGSKNVKNIKTRKLKLEEYAEIISQKAVDICKYDPLFWLNFKTTIFA
jgi:hypothetical protein